MEIVKKLVINTPHDFFNIIKDRKYSIDKITHFLGVMYLYTNGCPCDAEEHWNDLMEIYRSLDESDLSLIKNDVGCDIIQFLEDDKILFEV